MAERADTTRSMLEDQRCKSTLDSDALRDVCSWYDIWQAVVAIDGICGRFGKEGSAQGIGELCDFLIHGGSFRSCGCSFIAFLGSRQSLKIDLKVNTEETATA